MFSVRSAAPLSTMGSFTPGRVGWAEACPLPPPRPGSCLTPGRGVGVDRAPFGYQGRQPPEDHFPPLLGGERWARGGGRCRLASSFPRGAPTWRSVCSVFCFCERGKLRAPSWAPLWLLLLLSTPPLCCLVQLIGGGYQEGGQTSAIFWGEEEGYRGTILGCYRAGSVWLSRSTGQLFCPIPPPPHTSAERKGSVC